MKSNGIEYLSIVGLYLLHDHCFILARNLQQFHLQQSSLNLECWTDRTYRNRQNNIQQLLLINNKIQLTADYTTMSTANVVAHVVQGIIQQGKDVLKDRKISRQKVPPFSSRQSSDNYQEIVIHAGFQAENLKRHAHFTMRRDSMPENINKDNIAIKTHQVIHAPRSNIKQSPAFKSSQQKYYSSKKKSRQNSTHIVYGTHLEQRQKQNQLVKLEENHNNRIVVERVRLRDENEEDVMRQKRRQAMLKQYEQKLQNEVFQKQRLDKQAQKEKILQSHMKKGDNFKFDFDHNGELMLFQTSNQSRPIFTPQTNFKIHSQFEQEQEPIVNQKKMQRHKSFDHKAKQYADTHPLQRNMNEHQRIRSARGEAFASAVMKTVNLSRISMNGSIIEVDAQQFMKRNDLFNNNHSRQTTSIPYLKPINGTVYTEIATNQAVGSNKEPPSSTTALAKEDMSFQQRVPSRSGKTFEGFYQHLDRKYAKTARALGNRDTENEDLLKTSTRPVKTAKQSARGSDHSARRPHTSINRGRITTANVKLVQNLLNND